jgi:hypothetical protein
VKAFEFRVVAVGVEVMRNPVMSPGTQGTNVDVLGLTGVDQFLRQVRIRRCRRRLELEVAPEINA